jgi:hypothetical protein
MDALQWTSWRFRNECARALASAFDDDCGGGFDFSRFAFRARLGEREGSRAERRRMSDS